MRVDEESTLSSRAFQERRQTRFMRVGDGRKFPPTRLIPTVVLFLFIKCGVVPETDDRANPGSDVGRGGKGRRRWNATRTTRIERKRLDPAVRKRYRRVVAAKRSLANRRIVRRYQFVERFCWRNVLTYPAKRLN